MKERKKNRLVNYDYSKAGCYFITICLNDKKQHFLGDVLNGEMILSEYGKIIDKQWIWLQEQYEYVILDLYVVMPNHFHGILTINDFVGNGRDRSSDSKIKSISSLVGAFKTTSSKLIHQEGF